VSTSGRKKRQLPVEKSANFRWNRFRKLPAEAASALLTRLASDENGSSIESVSCLTNGSQLAEKKFLPTGSLKKPSEVNSVTPGHTYFNLLSHFFTLYIARSVLCKKCVSGFFEIFGAWPQRTKYWPRWHNSWTTS
jgi:hypothetical protein